MMLESTSDLQSFVLHFVQQSEICRAANALAARNLSLIFDLWPQISNSLVVIADDDFTQKIEDALQASA